jgi:hypothetical protein
MRSAQPIESDHTVVSRRSLRSRQVFAKRFGMETLEQRVLLADGLNTFARFSGDVAVPREVDEIAMRIDPGDFALPNRTALLGFALRASEGGTLDPGLIRVLRVQEATSLTRACG